jgi:hypothetical protein
VVLFKDRKRKANVQKHRVDTGGHIDHTHVELLGLVSLCPCQVYDNLVIPTRNKNEVVVSEAPVLASVQCDHILDVFSTNCQRALLEPRWEQKLLLNAMVVMLNG